MDFPVCPACHQSVIDDDAVDCPFCGASMKSKPGTKSVATVSKPTAAAKPAATASKPVDGKPASGKPASGKPTLPGDDFPFEMELTSGKSAIPAMPNPTKQRTLKVVCPMCDTPGYVPPNAAGQDVRCANAKCVMPVFTVPSPKKVEVAPPPPPPKSSNLLFYAGTTVVLMLAIGGGLYVVNTLPSNSGPSGPKEMSEEDKQMLADLKGGPKKNAAAVPLKIGPAEQNKNPVVAVLNADDAIAASDLIKMALKQMNDSSLEKTKQRNKPYCRQLAAEANAMTGHSKEAREHLEQLMKVGHNVSYYRIEPLLDLFWNEFSAGDKKSFANTLNTAMTEVPTIPKPGRTRQEIGGRLATALVAADRLPDALELLASFHSSDSDAQLAARLQMAMDGKVGWLSDSYSVLPWKFPQAVATTASLVTRGQLDAAAKWAASQPNEDGKAECLSVWAEEIAYRKAAMGAADSGGIIAAAVTSLPPALAARVWARVGYGRFRAKDQAGVIVAIKFAQDKIAAISKPAECKMPTVKLTDRFILPQAAPLLQAATAAAEVAFVQAQSPSTKVDAEASLDVAMNFVDAIAPSLAVAQQRSQEADHLGSAGLRKLMKDELKKKTDDEARLAANSYKRALNVILEAAQERFNVETQLLSRLRGAGVGLNSKVWIIVNSRTTADDINQRDNFFATSLPGELREGLRGTDEEKALLGAWSLRYKDSEPPRPPSVEFNERLEKDVSRAVDVIQKLDPKSNRREEIVLQAASRLPAMNKLPIAFQFIGRLDDIVVREDCYLMAAAVAAQRGQADAVWKQVAQVAQQTEKVALCRGMIAGLLAIGKPMDELPESATRP